MNQKEKKMFYVISLSVLIISVVFLFVSYVFSVWSKGRMFSALVAFSCFEWLTYYRKGIKEGEQNNDIGEGKVIESKIQSLKIFVSLTIILMALCIYYFLKDSDYTILRTVSVLMLMIVGVAIVPKSKNLISTVFISCVLIACFFVKPGGLDLTTIGLLGVVIVYLSYLVIRYFRKSDNKDSDRYHLD